MDPIVSQAIRESVDEAKNELRGLMQVLETNVQAADNKQQGMIQQVANQLAAIKARMDEAEKNAQEAGKVQGLSDQVVQLDRKVNAAEEYLKNIKDDPRADNSKQFRHKDAKDSKPGSWEESMCFLDLDMEIKTWARSFHDDMEELLRKAEEDNEEFLTIQTIDEGMFPEFVKLDQYVWMLLVGAIKGKAKAYIANPSNSGFQAWAQLVQRYDPRTGVDRTAALNRITNALQTHGQAKDGSQARQILQAWETEVSQFEKKYRKVEDDTKIVAIKSMMPAGMFGENGAYRGTAFNDYKTLRRTILKYLEDKPMVLPGKGPQTDVGNVDDAAKTEAEESHDPDGGYLCWVSREGYVSYKGGKSKGKGGGGGKGPKSVGCFNCGGNHFARDCTAKGGGKDAAKGYGGGKDAAKGYKGAGKGGPCYSCGEVGHIARNCPTGGQAGGGYGGYGGYGGKGSYGKGGKGLNNVGYVETPAEGDHQQGDGEWPIGQLWSLVDSGGKNQQQANGIKIKNRFGELSSAEADEEWPTFEDQHGRTTGNNDEKPKKMTRWRKPAKKKQAYKKCAERQSPEYGMKFEDLIACLGDTDNEALKPADCMMSCQDEEFVWVRREAAVDSGAVDCVANEHEFGHLEILPTPESIRGECWTCAGGKQIKKQGEVHLDFFTNEGHAHKVKMKIGKVSRTLISADKLLDKGSDVVLSKTNPRIQTRGGQVVKLRRRGGMFLLDMWVKMPKSKMPNASVFTRQGS